jgi:hypothetical protein
VAHSYHHYLHPHRIVGGRRPSDLMFTHMNHARDLARAGRLNKTSQTMKGKGGQKNQQSQNQQQQRQQQNQNSSGNQRSSSSSNHRSRRR